MASVSGGEISVVLELRGNPVGGQVAAPLAGAAAFQGIVGEILHRGPNLLRIDGAHRLLRLRWKAGLCVHHRHQQSCKDQPTDLTSMLHTDHSPSSTHHSPTTPTPLPRTRPPTHTQ